MTASVSNSKKECLNDLIGNSSKNIKENDLQIHSLSSQPPSDSLMATAKKAEALKEQALMEFSEERLNNSIKLCEEALKLEFNDTSLKTNILSDLVTYQLNLASHPFSSTEEEQRIGKAIEDLILQIDNQEILDGIALVIDTVLPTLSPTLKGILLNQRGLIYQKKNEIEKAQQCFFDVFPLEISNLALKVKVLNNLLSLIQSIGFNKVNNKSNLILSICNNLKHFYELASKVQDHPLKRRNNCPDLKVKFHHVYSFILYMSGRLTSAVSQCTHALDLPCNDRSLKEIIAKDLHGYVFYIANTVLNRTNLKNNSEKHAGELIECVVRIQKLIPYINEYSSKELKARFLLTQAHLYIREGQIFRIPHRTHSAIDLLAQALKLEHANAPLKTAIEELKNKLDSQFRKPETNLPQPTNPLEHLFY